MAPIAFWNAEKLEKRELLEIRNGGFGKGQLRDMYDDEDVDYNIVSEEEVDEDNKGEDENVNMVDDHEDESLMVRFTCL